MIFGIVTFDLISCIYTNNTLLFIPPYKTALNGIVLGDLGN